MPTSRERPAGTERSQSQFSGHGSGRRRSNTAQSNFRAVPRAQTDLGAGTTHSNASSNPVSPLGAGSGAASGAAPTPIPPPIQIPTYPPLKIGDSKVFHAWVHDVNLANTNSNLNLGNTGNDTHADAHMGVVFNHGWWPGVVEGDCLRVGSGGYGGHGVGVGGGERKEKKEGKGEDEKGFLFIVGKDDGGVRPQLQISFPRPVADAFGLRNNGEVVLTKVDKSPCCADHVEFMFQDQYLGRSEMWRLGKHLAGQCVYRDQEISYVGGIVAKVSNIFIGGREVPSAYMTTTTKAIYRSCSAKITIFIQVCRELWEFAGDGERYNEKIVHSFLPALFEKWRDAGTNHTVTIVLISRVFYEEGEIDYAAGPLQRDEEGGGLWYKDFFKVITDLEVIHEWKPTLVSLKNSFWDFQRDVLLTHHYHRARVDRDTAFAAATPSGASTPGAGPGVPPAPPPTPSPTTQVRLVGRLSDAHDGPILEALNLGLNPTENHYIDRSLNLTGSTTILVSPGTGYFRVNKGLLRLTTRRMLDQGFVCNLVVVGKEPTFQSPVVSFVGREPKVQAGGGDTGGEKERKVDPLLMDPLWGGDGEGAGEKKTFWWEPFWMSTTFWDKQMYLPFRQDRFVARAKMHEIQMLGLLEHDVLSSIEVPYIPEKDIDMSATISEISTGLSKEDADKFDLDTFSLTSCPRLGGTTGTNTTTTSIATSKANAEKRASAASHRHSAIVRIDTIEESPKPPIYKELPSEEQDPITPRAPASKPSSLMLNLSDSFGLSTSPSQSSIRSARSARSEKSAVSISGSLKGSGHGTQPKSATLSKGIASKLAPSWLFNPFRSGPSEPQTTTVSASVSPTTGVRRASGEKRNEKQRSSIEKVPSSSHAPVAAVAATSSSPIRMPAPKPTVAASTQQIQPVAIRGKAANRTSWNRGLEDDALHRNAYMRRSPMNTPPSDSFMAANKRRSVTAMTTSGNTLNLAHSYTSSSPGALLNPTRPHASITYPQASLARRWQHIFPKPVYKHDIKWKPLVTPGCLPLTVEHFPTSGELEMSYDVFSYEFVVDPREMKSFLVKPPSSATGGSGGLGLKGEELRRAYALVVMRGMAAVRLAQGFQFILRKQQRHRVDPEDVAEVKLGERPPAFRRNKSFVSVAGAGVGGAGAGADDERDTRPMGAAEVLRSTMDPVYLSMTNEIHRISYNGEAIQVKRYVRRMSPSVPIHYKCLIWPKLGGGYTELTTSFKSHGLENYGWNRLDMLVAGYEHDFNESMRYWRTRFIVIPTIEPPLIREAQAAGNEGEELNEEEARIMGIEKLAEMFTKLRWMPPLNTSEEKEKEKPLPVRFLPTTLDPAMSVLDESLMDQLDAIHAQGPLRKKIKSEREIGDMSLKEIAKAMRGDSSSSSSSSTSSSEVDLNGIRTGGSSSGGGGGSGSGGNGASGLPIKFHQWHGQPYPDSFTGYEFVSWLVREFRDVGTRAQATEWGIRLQDKGLFEHCRGKHSFLDGHYYYRLIGEYASHSSNTATPKYWFLKQDGTLRGSYLHLKSHNSNNPPKGVSKAIGTGTGGTGTRKIKKSVILSQTMVIDIDPSKKSDQAESVILHHDIIHNPSTVFHFELQWIGTTARCIEDQLKAWNRNIEEYGLKIVEAYVTQISDIREHNPFQSCFPMRLALAPPSLPFNVIPGCIPPHAPHPGRGYYFHYAILRKFNFILDVEASSMYPDPEHMEVVYSYRRSPYEYSQFVHVSGVAFVQVLSGGSGGMEGFLFLTNRLMGSGKGIGRAKRSWEEGGGGTLKAKNLANEAEKLREEMEAFCGDKEKLKRFYEGLMKSLPKMDELLTMSV